MGPSYASVRELKAAWGNDLLVVAFVRDRAAGNAPVPVPAHGARAARSVPDQVKRALMGVSGVGQKAAAAILDHLRTTGHPAASVADVMQFLRGGGSFANVAVGGGRLLGPDTNALIRTVLLGTAPEAPGPRLPRGRGAP
jgi:hypothetical protein